MASDYAIRAAKEINGIAAEEGIYPSNKTVQFAQVIDAAFAPVLHENENAVEKMMDVQRARLVAEQDAHRLRAAVVTLGDVCRETLEHNSVFGTLSQEIVDMVTTASELAKTVLEHGAVVPERTP